MISSHSSDSPRRGIFPVLVSLLFTSASAQAASVSYFLDQSNRLADSPSYLQVTIADGVDGAIDFTVEALGSLTSMGGSNFGIQSFYFSVDGGDASDLDITGLPNRWRAITRDRNASGFGRFDVRVRGRGNARVDTLTFSITDVEGDTPLDYALLSSRNARQGNQFFAAHVAGFLTEKCSDKTKKCTNITSAFFGGSTAVPLPGAAWLFATGIVGAALRARRRRTS